MFTWEKNYRIVFLILYLWEYMAQFQNWELYGISIISVYLEAGLSA